jgi:hypothetical protein
MKHTIIALFSALLLCGCANVDVTKTGKGYHEPTDANQVEIFNTKPTRAFEELGELTVSNFPASDTAKLHNALRTKAAPLGANAVFITARTFAPGPTPKVFVSAVAIRWTEQAAK